MRRNIWMFLALILLLGAIPQAASAKDSWSIEGAGNITSISVAQDGTNLAIGTYGSKAYVYDMEGNQQFSAEAGNVVTAVQLLADGTLLFSSDDRHLYAYDKEGVLLWDMDLKKQIKSMSASQDGSVLALVVQRSSELLLMDAVTGQQTGAIPIGTTMKAVKVSSDGQWVAVATSDQYTFLLDADGKTFYKYGAGDQIQGVSVSDDGDVAIGTKSSEVELIDQDGKLMRKLLTKDIVTDVSFSKDGESIAVSDLSGFFYIFDRNGKKLWESKVNGEGREVEFDHDGMTLFAGTGDGIILKHDVSSVVKEAKGKANRKMLLWALGSMAALAGLLFLLFYMKKKQRLGIFRLIWQAKWIYLGLAPTFILLFMFQYYPAFSGLVHSFYDWQPGGRTTFIGLANFERMIHDPYVTKGLGNLGLLIVTGLIKTLIPPLIAAELIYHLRSKKLQYGFRTAFTISMVIPAVAVLLIWQNFYDPNVGLFNNFLELIGLGSWAHGWLGDPNTALWSLIFIGFPFIGILQLLVFYAGLLSISGELIESAKIDGATLPRIIRSIHLPLLAGQFKFLIILALIGIIQDFNGIMIVTGGGPMDSTYVPALQMYYAATKFNDLGYASALGVSMFVVVLAITIVNMKFIKTSND
ncbi:ABC transporter permease [Paenibacillus sp. FSL H8-0548]|uniref:ABC transporter permease subunit n=1 Tax=Paenibacillus sp. FSL H8-0548 TaxID=1920422 RepID=UPI00096ED2DE|nr:ABC transporter permease subunit [Paenibacillus sp. FSL H8-0548]OMF30790.1 ABC transporter permease [Paenibacillus sp. FSL H8-0548]